MATREPALSGRSSRSCAASRSAPVPRRGGSRRDGPDHRREQPGLRRRTFPLPGRSASCCPAPVPMVAWPPVQLAQIGANMTHPLLQAALSGGTPVVDDNRATFLWQGEQPPYLVGDFNGWNPDEAAPWSAVEAGPLVLLPRSPGRRLHRVRLPGRAEGRLPHCPIHSTTGHDAERHGPSQPLLLHARGRADVARRTRRRRAAG